MAEILIAVEITHQEAAVFRSMREQGAFDIKDGTVSLNFKGGIFRSMKVESYTQVPSIDSSQKNHILE